MGLTDNLFRRKHVRGDSNQAQVLPANSSTTANGSRWGISEKGRTGWVSMSNPFRDPLDLGNPHYVRMPRCVCDRSTTLVVCIDARCGWSAVGRARTFCPSHPNVTFLYDLPQCPKCVGPVRETKDESPGINS